MTSINTNPSAMTALRSLQATNKELQKVQNRISTGLEVESASDNAAYWSIATTMRSDNNALKTVQDALGLGAAKVDTTYTGLTTTLEVVGEIKVKIVAAREPGVDRSKIQAEILQLQDQLRAAAESASFTGENWLAVDSSDPSYSTTKSIVSSFTRNSSGVSVQTIDIDITSTELYDANDQSGLLDTTFTTTGAGAVSVSVDTLDVSDPNLDDTDIDDMISNVDAVLLSVTTAASDIGAAKKRISMQQDFVSSLIDAIDRGVGTLVDADMNKESTRLQALQVQQQLGIQSLTIANANAQAILALFQ